MTDRNGLARRSCDAVGRAAGACEPRGVGRVGDSAKHGCNAAISASLNKTAIFGGRELDRAAAGHQDYRVACNLVASTQAVSIRLKHSLSPPPNRTLVRVLGHSAGQAIASRCRPKAFLITDSFISDTPTGNSQSRCSYTHR